MGSREGPELSGELKRKIGRNVWLFRKVYEAIVRGLCPDGDDRLVAFRCECARLDCNKPVRMTLGEYEHVRSHPRRFMLSPGHEIDHAVTVIERHPAYVVVEKRQEAGVVAEQMDPRS
jgi:hypothetical protein